MNSHKLTHGFTSAAIIVMTVALFSSSTGTSIAVSKKPVQRTTTCSLVPFVIKTSAQYARCDASHGIPQDVPSYSNDNNSNVVVCTCAGYVWPTPLPNATSTPSPIPTLSGGGGPYCGDNVCNNGETCGTCARDCGACGGGNRRISFHVSPTPKKVNYHINWANLFQGIKTF